MEHKKKENIELIEHIQDTLQDYTEAYKPGAWENFKKTQVKESKKVVPLWRWASVAAAVVVSLSVLLFVSKDPVVDNTMVDRNKGETEQLNQDVQGENSQDMNAEMSDSPVSGRQLATSSNRVKTVDALSDNQSSVNEIAANDIASINQGVSQETIADVVAQVPKNAIAANAVENAAVDPAVNPSVSPSTASPSTVVEAAMEKADRQNKLNFFNKNRWSLGFMIAPAINQNANDVNLGYGVSVNYALSKKLSLSSGLAYNKMNASKDLPTNLGASSIVLNNNKKLAVISEEVSGIDMPIELKYQFNPKLYANFGLSGFAVINQQRSNTFIQDVVVNRSDNSSASTSMPGGSAGASSTSKSDPLGPQGQFANAFIVQQRTTENVASQAMDNINFLGFYNFSVGYTHRIYKQNTLSIEPFFKLPIRAVTQDNLRMVGTGVRIKVGF